MKKPPDLSVEVTEEIVAEDVFGERDPVYEPFENRAMRRKRWREERRAARRKDK